MAAHPGTHRVATHESSSDLTAPSRNYSPINEQPPHTAQGAWLPACKRRSLRLRPQHQRDRPLKDDDHRRVQLARRHSAHTARRSWQADSRYGRAQRPTCSRGHGQRGRLEGSAQRHAFMSWALRRVALSRAAPIPIPTVSTGGARQRVGRGLQPYISRGSPRACLYCSTKKPAASSSSSV